jgi:hypothetical protein
LQNGSVHRYLAGLLIGGALIFYCGSKPEVDFDYEYKGDNVVELRPSIGDGLDAKGATVDFDLDLDGEPDVSKVYDPRQPMVVEYAFGGAGDYKVTMTMTDSVFEKKYSVTKTIHIKEESAEGGAQ